MYSVFFEPTLQPVMQSPQSVHAGCETPQPLSAVSSKVTTMSSNTVGTPNSWARFSSASRFNSGLPAGSGFGRRTPAAFR